MQDKLVIYLIFITIIISLSLSVSLSLGYDFLVCFMGHHPLTNPHTKESIIISNPSALSIEGKRPILLLPSAGDVFENYCWGDDLMNVCRGAYAFTILLTFPIECFVARDVLETAFFREHQPQPFFRHAFLSVIIALFCMFLSLATDCLGIVLELNVSRISFGGRDLLSPAFDGQALDCR